MVRGEMTQTAAGLCCDGTGCSALPQLLQTAGAESCAPLALRGTAHWHIPQHRGQCLAGHRTAQEFLLCFHRNRQAG